MSRSLARSWASAPVPLRVAAASMALLALTLVYQDAVTGPSEDAGGQGALAVALVLFVSFSLFAAVAAWLLRGSRVAWCIAAVLGLLGLAVPLQGGTAAGEAWDALTTALSGALLVPLLFPTSLRRVWARRTSSPRDSERSVQRPSAGRRQVGG